VRDALLGFPLSAVLDTTSNSNNNGNNNNDNILLACLRTVVEHLEIASLEVALQLLCDWTQTH